MRGVPAEGGSEAYLVRTPQMGLFQQPARINRFLVMFSRAPGGVSD